LPVVELVTKYKNWQEIKNGNIAVALTTGGKLLAIMNIFRFSIERNEPFLVMIGWGIFGFLLFFAGYFIFEFLTPTFKIDEEIEKLLFLSQTRPCQHSDHRTLRRLWAGSAKCTV
jgi:putative membrane protein